MVRMNLKDARPLHLGIQGSISSTGDDAGLVRDHIFFSKIGRKCGVGQHGRFCRATIIAYSLWCFPKEYLVQHESNGSKMRHGESRDSGLFKVTDSVGFFLETFEISLKRVVWAAYRKELHQLSTVLMVVFPSVIVSLGAICCLVSISILRKSISITAVEAWLKNANPLSNRLSLLLLLLVFQYF